VLVAMTGVLGGAACSSSHGAGASTDTDDRDENVGTLGIDLTLASGAVINTVSYVITGPGGFTKTGSFDVSQSSKIQGLIAGLPSGDGYSISLTANSTDGATKCAGSASFKVTARATTPVAVAIRCHQAPGTGSVLVNGTVNICAAVDGISANPSQALVGAPISLEALAHDSDASPKPLSYAWSASSGSFSDPSAKNPIFKCSTAGTVTVNLTVSDGDCGDKASVDIECAAVDKCAAYNVYMADLGELTANCRGRIDPRDFSIDRLGNLVPNFDTCVTKAPITPILQHLSIQNKLQLEQKAGREPLARACIGTRFAQALDKFSSRGVQTCPTWSLDHVVNPITDEVIKQVTAELPQANSDGVLMGDVPQDVIDALKIKHVYNVSFNGPAPSQQCKDATDCAQACAEAFAGFVMGPVPGAVGQVLTDTTSWLDTTVFVDVSTDKYLRGTFFHTMSYYLGAPGVQHGDYNRYVSCDPASGGTCDGSAPESCSYYVGNVPNGFHKKTQLQPHCTDWTNINTCTTFCGDVQTGADAPPMGWVPLPPAITPPPPTP